MSRQDGVLVHDEEFVPARLTPHAAEASHPIAATSVSPLTRDFLAWIASTPHSYSEAMEAWRSSCPRLTIWEDALGDDLIRMERDGGKRLSESRVVLTPRGRALLHFL